MANNVLTDSLSEPLNGATTAKVDVNTGTGNLTIDRLTDDEQLLASGTLQYLENQGVPNRSVKTSNGQTKMKNRNAMPRKSRLSPGIISGSPFSFAYHFVIRQTTILGRG